MSTERAPGLDPTALRRAAGRRSTPWPPEAQGRLVVGNVIAVLLIVAGWVQVSGVGVVRTQLAWMNLSLVALVVAGVANATYLFRGMESLALAKEHVLRRAADRAPAAPAVEAGVNGHLPVALVHLDGSERYHRADCLTVTGKVTSTASRDGHERAERRPCPVCQP